MQYTIKSLKKQLKIKDKEKITNWYSMIASAGDSIRGYAQLLIVSMSMPGSELLDIDGDEFELCKIERVL